MVALEIPGVVHPATTAATVAIVRPNDLRGTPVGAGDQLLLGQVHRGRVVLDGDSALESGVGCEGPARAASALVLHGKDLARGGVVDRVGGAHESAAAIFTPRKTLVIVCCVAHEAHHSFPLSVIEVGEGVVAKGRGIGVA